MDDDLLEGGANLADLEEILDDELVATEGEDDDSLSDDEEDDDDVDYDKFDDDYAL